MGAAYHGCASHAARHPSDFGGTLGFVLSAMTLVLLSAAPATVLDDFLELPDAAFGEWKADRSERKKAVKDADLKNGFLSGEYENGKFEAALFIRQDGGHVLGLKHHPFDMGCPTLAIQFYARSGNAWVEVTDSVWPAIDEAAVAKRVRKVVKDEVRDQCTSSASDLEWSLPRVGTTLTGVAAWTPDVQVLAEWKRQPGRFELRDPALRVKK